MCDPKLIADFIAKGGVIKDCGIAPKPDLTLMRPGKRRAMRERLGTRHGSFYKHC